MKLEICFPYTRHTTEGLGSVLVIANAPIRRFVASDIDPAMATCDAAQGAPRPPGHIFRDRWYHHTRRAMPVSNHKVVRRTRAGGTAWEIAPSTRRFECVPCDAMFAGPRPS